MSKIKDYLYELEMEEMENFENKLMEEMTMRAYEEGVGIELYDEEDTTPDEVFEPEYLGDR